MGYQLAEAAFDQHQELNGTQMRMLLRMALVASDGPEPRYWAGWELLAHGIGADMPWAADESDEANRLRSNARRRVQDLLAQLCDVGAISRVGRGGNGRRAEYLLHLCITDRSPCE